MRLLVLAFTYMLLAQVPALAQTSQGGSSDAQYRANAVGSGTARGAVQAALMASGALQASSEEAEGNSASAAESSDISSEEAEGNSASAAESSDIPSKGGAVASTGAQYESANTPGLEKLPNTGGPSPMWLFSAPLICVGGILARRIVLPWREGVRKE